MNKKDYDKSEELKSKYKKNGNEKELRKEKMLYKLENKLKEIEEKFELIKEEDIKITNKILDEKEFQKQCIEKELSLLREELKEKDSFNKMNLKLKIIDKESQLKLFSLLLNEEKEKFLLENKEIVEEHNKKLFQREKLKNEIVELKEKIERVKSQELNLNYIKDEDFMEIKGGNYKPSFANERKEVFDLEVYKYPTTQVMWTEVMGYNPSRYKSNYRPVENITWWKILEYCNKLSEKCYLEPVYDLSKSEEGILMIRELDGKVVHAYMANFKNTEGFRLPTEVEWEWFAKDGKAIEDEEIENLGLQKSYQLKFRSVSEWCYDTTENIENGKLHICRFCDEYRRTRVFNKANYSLSRRNKSISTTEKDIIFRVVRTKN